jgi:ATP-dependent protease Clp ATPase subunit
MKDDKDGFRYCDFCGKREDRALVLMRGAAAEIFDGCIDICVRIVAKRRAQDASPATTPHNESLNPMTVVDPVKPIQHRDALDRLSDRIERHLNLLIV